MDQELRACNVLSHWVETFTSATALSLRLFASNLARARNLHQAALIPWLPTVDAPVARSKKGQCVIEVERDGRLGIDLKFGTITFKEEKTATYAVSLIDVLVGENDTAGGTRVQMEVKVPVDPDADPILAITERCRTQIVSTLRAAADRFDGMSARAMLFEGAD